MRKYGIFIDGEGVVDGVGTMILLQTFSKTAIGPIFFGFIQRKVMTALGRVIGQGMGKASTRTSAEVK